MNSLPKINLKAETEKIVKFLNKTFSEQKIDKVVLGLSGGIDSTVILYLLKKALPEKNIYAVQMDFIPRKKLGIDLNGINVINFPIREMINDFERQITNVKTSFFRQSPGGPIGLRRSRKTVSNNHIKGPVVMDNVRLGNIMARVRMIILFDLAKQLGALVCGTENKSENLLGYFTRFGDQASDIEPIAHLYKTQVRQLASYLKVPKKIIDQSPTAGLWDGQTDEKEFGFTYEEADQVLFQFMNLRFPSFAQGYGMAQHGDDILIKQLEKTFSNAQKIIERVKNNQFKLKTPYSL